MIQFQAMNYLNLLFIRYLVEQVPTEYNVSFPFGKYNHPHLYFKMFTVSILAIESVRHSASSSQRLFIVDETQSNSSVLDHRSLLESAIDRRRSFVHDRPRTAISGIVRSYSSSSFESPDEDPDSDWDDDDEEATTEIHSSTSATEQESDSNHHVDEDTISQTTLRIT